MRDYDVVIVGGGSGGLNAALVLARALRSVLVIDSGEARNAAAGHMHGYLGADGMPPQRFRDRGNAEIAGYGAERVSGRVHGITGDVNAGFTVEVDGGPVRARRIVVATGARDELSELPGLAERWGRDVHPCPYCHGYEVRHQRIAVLGGGEIDLHKALLLSQWSADVTVYLNGAAAPEPAAAARLTARGIGVVTGAVTGPVLTGDRLSGLRLADGSVHGCDVVFASPRAVPNDAPLRALGARRTATPFGDYVEVSATGRTSVAGVWAVGNVTDPAAQVITAAAAGARAAADINADLVMTDTDRAVQVFPFSARDERLNHERLFGDRPLGGFRMSPDRG